MKISLLLIILFSLCSSQNIITSWNYDKVAMYDIQKINTYLQTEFSPNNPFELSNEISSHNIIVKNISLVGVQTSLYDSFLNYNNGIFLFTPNKITLNFNFSYSELTKGYKGTAILEIKLDVLTLKIENDKEKQKAQISVKMSAPKENYNVQDITDKEFLSLLIDTLYTGFQTQSILGKTVSEKFSSGILNYYNEIYSKKKIFKIRTTQFFGDFIFPMNNNKFLYFCEDLLGEYNNTFCYSHGYSDIDEEIKDKTKIPLSNERFSHNYDDLYNIFVNKDLIHDIFRYICESYFHFYPKRYDNKTNVKQLSYDFTVASLKKYFNGLQNLKDKDFFYCDVYINNITLNAVNYTVRFNIDTFNFTVKINSKINVDIVRMKKIRFDLCLNETKTTNVEVVSSPPETKVEIKDLDGLKKAIDESFDYERNKICFTNEGISMRDYFTKINDIYMREEGLYLEGNHLYQ